MGDGALQGLVGDAELLPLLDGLHLDLFPVLAKNVVEFSVTEREVLVHLLVSLFGNFLPLLGYNPHYLFGIQLRLLALDDLPPLLREEQVRAKWLPWRLHVFFDFILLLLEVSSHEVPVHTVPELPLSTLLKRLELSFASGQHPILATS